MNPERLEDYELDGIEQWASLIFARVHEGGAGVITGYIFVIDPVFGDDAKHKLPGGHRKTRQMCSNGDHPDATPLDTAVREFAGETGITLPREAFTYAGKELGRRRDHWKFLFVAELSFEDRSWMSNLHHENEGEIPQFVSVAEFAGYLQSGKFLPAHHTLLASHSLALPR